MIDISQIRNFLEKPEILSNPIFQDFFGKEKITIEDFIKKYKNIEKEHLFYPKRKNNSEWEELVKLFLEYDLKKAVFLEVKVKNIEDQIKYLEFINHYDQLLWINDSYCNANIFCNNKIYNALEQRLTKQEGFYIFSSETNITKDNTQQNKFLNLLFKYPQRGLIIRLEKNIDFNFNLAIGEFFTGDFDYRFGFEFCKSKLSKFKKIIFPNNTESLVYSLGGLIEFYLQNGHIENNPNNYSFNPVEELKNQEKITTQQP